MARRLVAHRLATPGLVILALLVAGAIFAPYLAPYDPLKRNFAERLAAPSAAHWMGTDSLGRDMLSRILYGGRLSLYIGVVSVLFSLAIGVPIGLLAGYFGGLVDAALMRLVDLILSFPTIIFAIFVAVLIGPGVSTVILVYALLGMTGFARIVRGSVLSVKHSDYVLASHALGIRHGRILVAHILPNVLPAILIVTSLSIPGFIIAGAGLSFLGLGARPPTPEWGAMLGDGRAYLQDAWWVAVFPGLVLMLTLFACSVIGDALRDVLDPRTTSRQK